jgi:hypothetical protein
MILILLIFFCNFYFSLMDGTFLILLFTLQIDCLVCSFCFCFIGSIELQIGMRVYLKDLGFFVEVLPWKAK